MASSDFMALAQSLDPPLWIVTAADGTSRGGLLATFVNQASIVGALPRMVAGISKRHRTRELIEASGAFVAHLMTASKEHLDLVDRFGLESSRSVDKFSGVNFHDGSTGSPILDQVAGWAECKVEERFDTGDRTIFLADVVDSKAPEGLEILTVQRWVKVLPPKRLARLKELFAIDSTADAEAIRAWRRKRSET